MESTKCDRNAAINALRNSERTLAGKVRKDFIELTNEDLDLIERYILDIPVIGEYGDNDTPLDNFDSQCHDCKDGIKKTSGGLGESKIMFLINTAEHIGRPADMLMLIGEYFKEVVRLTGLISNNIKSKKNGKKV